MARRPFTPPTPTEGIVYVKFPEEAVRALGTCESKGQYDQLAGALTRYFLTGEEEGVPKSLRALYRPLLPIYDRIRSGIATGGRRTGDAQVSDQSRTSHAPVNDQSRTSACSSQAPTGPLPAEMPPHPRTDPATPYTDIDSDTPPYQLSSGYAEQLFENRLMKAREEAEWRELDLFADGDALDRLIRRWCDAGWTDRNGQALDATVTYNGERVPRWVSAMCGYHEGMVRRAEAGWSAPAPPRRAARTTTPTIDATKPSGTCACPKCGEAGGNYWTTYTGARAETLFSCWRCGTFSVERIGA